MVTLIMVSFACIFPQHDLNVKIAKYQYVIKYVLKEEKQRIQFLIMHGPHCTAELEIHLGGTCAITQLIFSFFTSLPNVNIILCFSIQ